MLHLVIGQQKEDKYKQAKEYYHQNKTHKHGSPIIKRLKGI
jgi:hypothetical protein